MSICIYLYISLLYIYIYTYISINLWNQAHIIHWGQFCYDLPRPLLRARHLRAHKVISTRWFRKRIQTQKLWVTRPGNRQFFPRHDFPHTFLTGSFNVIYLGCPPIILPRLASLSLTWRSTWRAWPRRAVQLARCLRVSIPRLFSLSNQNSYMDACMG